MAAKRKQKAASAPEVSALSIEVPEIDVRSFRVYVRGISPLLTRPMDAKSLEEIEGKAKGKAHKGKLKDEVLAEEMERSRFRDDEGRNAFPAVTMKIVAVEGGARHVGKLSMTEARQLVFIEGQWVPLYGPEPEVFKNVCRVGPSKQPVPRYRPKWWPWAMEFTVTYNAGTISMEQILSLYRLGGFHCGVGDYRPGTKMNNGGTFGRFEICNEEDIAAIRDQSLHWGKNTRKKR